MLTIARLRVGDRIRNDSGTRGKVTGFTRDFVAIEWDGGRGAALTDADLKSQGVVNVSAFEDAEDTIP